MNRNPCVVTDVPSTITLMFRSTDVKLPHLARCAHTGPVKMEQYVVRNTLPALGTESCLFLSSAFRRIKAELLMCVCFKFSDMQHSLPSALPLTCGEKLPFYCEPIWLPPPPGLPWCSVCGLWGGCHVLRGLHAEANTLNFPFAPFPPACSNIILK